ncbi:MAG: hypothetical protein JSS07_08840 [Proteobacteria bacterium]|nr:hypothetical protein [Pseudomonadota bacterium]
MRLLTNVEQSTVAGGTDERSNWDRFWVNYAESAGTMAGYCSGPFIAIGAGVGAIAYYAIYTPIYYLVYGAYSAIAAVGNGIYVLGEGAYHAVAD